MPSCLQPKQSFTEAEHAALVTMATAEHRETMSLVHLSKVVATQGEGDFTGTKSFKVPMRFLRVNQTTSFY